MHTVHLQFASAEDAEWFREICQKQMDNPGERVDKLYVGILIDSIRKAKSVSKVHAMVADKDGVAFIWSGPRKDVYLKLIPSDIKDLPHI